MKMKPEHYEALKKAMRPIVKSKTWPDHLVFIKTETKAKDPEKRARWDALFASRTKLPPHFINDVLYAYLDDTHIDTALKSIMRELSSNAKTQNADWAIKFDTSRDCLVISPDYQPAEVNIADLSPGDASIEQARAYARRIAACMKFCEGVETEWFENRDQLTTILRTKNNAIYQREALRDALREVHADELASNHHGDGPEGCSYCALINA